MNIFIKLGLVLVFGFMGGKLASKLNLPNVTGYLIGGIFLGTSFFNVITQSDSQVINFINEFTLSAIAFNIGGEFLWDTIKKLGKDVVIITIAEVIGAVVIVFILMYFVMSQDFVFSLMVASMSAATAPAGTMLVIKQYRAKGPMTDMILPIAALDDALGIMVFGLALSLSKVVLGKVSGSTLSLVLAPFIEIAASLLLGFVIGFILSRISKHIKSSQELVVVIILTLLLTSGLSMLLNLSSLLCAMMVGATYINLGQSPSRTFNAINNFVPPFNILFFALAGSSLDLSILTNIGLIGIVYVMGRMSGKVLGTRLGAVCVGSSETIRKYLGWALLPQGGVSIGLSMIVSAQLPEYREEIVGLILFSVLIFEIIGPILAKISITKAKEITV